MGRRSAWTFGGRATRGPWGRVQAASELGLLALASGGGSDGRPRCARMDTSPQRSVMSDTTRRRPPQGRESTSSKETRFRSEAQSSLAPTGFAMPAPRPVRGPPGAASSLASPSAVARIAEASLKCVLIVPTTKGAVRDTHIVEGSEVACGHERSAWTGHVGYAPAQMLLRFEPTLPKTGEVRAATVTLHHKGDDKASVRAHRITAPWSDDTTWSSFDGAYDARVEAEFTSSQGARTFDIFELTQAWVDGTVENDGLLLEQDVEGATQFRTSDRSDPTDRPTLEVCYLIGAQM